MSKYVPPTPFDDLALGIEYVQLRVFHGMATKNDLRWLRDAVELLENMQVPLERVRARA